MYKGAGDLNLIETLSLVTFDYMLVVLRSNSLSERCFPIAPIIKLQLLSTIIHLLYYFMQNAVQYFLLFFFSFYVFLAAKLLH